MMLCLWAFCAVQAQSVRKGDKFFDGATLWEVQAIWGNKTVFFVGTGEIYMSLEVVDAARGEYRLVPSSQADEPSIPGAEFGWRVQYIRKDGMNFLAVRKPERPSDVTSNALLNRYYLSKIASKKELRLLRNEILARHGYRFQSRDLQEWFGQQPWYRPGNNNAAISLSIIEQTNVQLIKSEEAARQR